eukprot:scaffold8658_cov101-Cylindrotheca_fusiformis.AAC.6
MRHYHFTYASSHTTIPDWSGQKFGVFLLFLSTTMMMMMMMAGIPTAAAFSFEPPKATALSSSSSSSSANRIVVVGGTHGNEYTGVWCIKALQVQQQELKDNYPSLKIKTILANEEAHLANQRFIDTDLNREFRSDTLCSIDDDDDDGNVDGTEESLYLYDPEDECDSVEAQRAKELDAILGSKCCADEEDAFDVAIDLHSTTTNMGITLIVNEGDELMTQGAAYVAHVCGAGPAGRGEKYDTRILMHSIPEREERPTLSSAAKHGFTIEVGPVPTGVLRHDAVKKTELAMHALLKFLQLHNDDDHEENNGSSRMLAKELERLYPGGSVPCFRTAPAKRAGEISGKIPWPCDPENPNFPALMVHESLQDRDFSLLKIGDPLFVAPDRSVVHYDGSHGDNVYVIFVNEAGYYYEASGTGIGVAVSSEYDLWSGLLKDTEEGEFEGTLGHEQQVVE